MDVETIQRARNRISSMRSGEKSKDDLAEVVTRAREEIAELSQITAELRASIPGQLSEAIHKAIDAEVLPVARHIAEVRGLSAQMIRRLENTQSSIESEREARIDDLDLLVDLLVSSWQGIDTRLSQIESQLTSLGHIASTEKTSSPIAVSDEKNISETQSENKPLSALTKPIHPTSALG